MFKRQYRLPAHVRLSPIQMYSCPLFQVKKAANSLDIVRVGFIVSKKIDKRAVVRNRTKRVFRSVVEDLFHRMQPGVDLLFVLRKPIEERTEELEKEVETILIKAEIV